MNLPELPSEHAVRPLLLRIGLDPREIEVYLALLALGSARATKIARLSKQSRSHTYLMLRSLEKRGLASEVERGKVLVFIASPPERLLTYLEDKEKEIGSLKTLAEGALAQLTSLTSQHIDVPRVSLLHGMEGMKQVYREVMREQFCGLFNAQSMYAAFGKSVVPLVLPKGQEHLRGKDLLVDNDGAKKFLKENKQNKEYAIRLLPKNTIFHTDTMVFGDVIALFTYDEDSTIIRIQSRNMADSFRAWFEILWLAGRPT